MAYPLELTALLTGATVNQLRRWSRKGILVPEVNSRNPMVYSFRDVVALRAVAALRAKMPLQSIHKALSTLSDFEMTEHPSEYKFATDGKSIKVWTDDGFLDLVKRPGQYEFKTLEDIYRPFTNLQGRRVPDLERPKPHVSINPRRLSGWPTVSGTRIGFDSIADLLADGDISPAEIRDYYPSVSAEAVADVIEFQRDLEAEAA